MIVKINQNKLTVVCTNHGTHYSTDYTHKLYAMVSRHLKIPHHFICLTDEPSRYKNAPFEVRKEQSGLSGWWVKTGMFNPKNRLKGRILYLDLDIIILKDLSPLIEPHLKTKDFWIIEDWLEATFNSSVMLFSAERCHHLYEAFSWRDQGIYQTDQHFLHAKLDHYQLFDRTKIVSYKHDHCDAAPPDDARIVVFHGYPKPHHFETGWVSEKWG